MLLGREMNESLIPKIVHLRVGFAATNAQVSKTFITFDRIIHLENGKKVGEWVKIGFLYGLNFIHRSFHFKVQLHVLNKFDNVGCDLGNRLRSLDARLPFIFTRQCSFPYLLLFSNYYHLTRGYLKFGFDFDFQNIKFQISLFCSLISLVLDMVTMVSVLHLM